MGDESWRGRPLLSPVEERGQSIVRAGAMPGSLACLAGGRSPANRPRGSRLRIHARGSIPAAARCRIGADFRALAAYASGLHHGERIGIDRGRYHDRLGDAPMSASAREGPLAFSGPVIDAGRLPATST